MNVWVFNQFAGSPVQSSGAGERYHFIAKNLQQRYGISFIIFAASYNHLFIRQPDTRGLFTQEEIEGIRYCWVRTSAYDPSRGWHRLRSWISFMIILFRIPKGMARPDRIIVSSMSMFPIYPALWYRFRRKDRIKIVFEIRDIWPLTLIELGRVSRLNPVVIWLSFTEWLAYRSADQLVSVLPFAHEHVAGKVRQNRSVTWIPNGADHGALIRDDVGRLDFENKLDGKRVVTYAGAVGTANQLEGFLSAHQQLRHPQQVVFLILGMGPELQRLKNRFGENPNIIFAGKVPKFSLHPLLRRSDILFIGWHDSALYRFGVSANKYCDYMIARKPILSAGGLRFDPVKESGCGISIPSAGPREIAEAINSLTSRPVHELAEMGERGFQYFLKNNSIEVISEKFYSVLKV